MIADLAFARSDFERLGRTTTEAEAVDVLRTKVDRLIAMVNRLTQAKRLDEMRTMWNPGAKPGEFFRSRAFVGVDYVYGSAGHWYIYHRGGRWEPQFNIGMYGKPGRGYLRIGLGFNLTTQSRDPERLAGAARVRALFAAFNELARGRIKAGLQELLNRPHAILEQVSDSHAPEVLVGTAATTWLTALRQTDAPRWIFLGRRLSCSTNEDATILADWKELGAAVDRELALWTPIWKEMWAAA